MNGKKRTANKTANMPTKSAIKIAGRTQNN